MGHAAAAVERWPVPAVLAAFVAAEWIAVLALALTVRHSGWIYYQGGDQLWYWTLGWLLSHGELGHALVGYGLPAYFAPFARVTGPNLVDALPAIVLLNVLVLLPVAMLALYGIAARIGGRLFGYWTLVVWIAVPFIGIRYTNVGFHQTYTELLLPQAFGLTALADFPAMVAVLVTCYFCARTLFDPQPHRLDAIATGVAAGVTIALKPSASIVLAGLVLALACRRRFASLGLLAAGLAPALLALAVWKERGLGYLPILSYSPHTLATGPATAGGIGAVDVGRYLHQVSVHRLAVNIDLIREHFWSARVIEWLVVAGLVALARRSREALLLVGGWFAAFVVVKGGYTSTSVEDGSLFRVIMPAFPAFVLLLAALPLLLPHAPSRLRDFVPQRRWTTQRTRIGLVAVAVVASAVVPLGAIAAARLTGGPADAGMLSADAMPIPTNVDLGLRATPGAGRVTLRWRPQSASGSPVFYRVWRGAAGSDGFTCPPAPGARNCFVSLPEIGVTHTASYVDRPPPGRWVYRIAVAANWLDNPAFGDVYLVSAPRTTVRR
jgi:hypothetical protein